MKLAFASTFDVHNVHKRSGTPFHMTKYLSEAGVQIEHISPLKTRVEPGFKLKRAWRKLACGQHDSSRWNIYAAKSYAEQVKKQLADKNVDGVMTHIVNSIAYLDFNKPLILWTDALYASLHGFIPNFDNHSVSTIHDANAITREFLKRSQLAIFSSDWAAQGAIEFFGAKKEIVKVVPFGANMLSSPTLADVRNMLSKRSRTTIKFLFLGKEWERKGGKTVLEVTQALHAAGHKVELLIVGCHPPEHEKMPDYVKCVGYISKKTPDGLAAFNALFNEAHFLFLPSTAEAFGIAFCEANAFGLPALTSTVGGIPTVVKDNINGKKFPLDATVKEYCDYIVDLMQDYARYEELALSSFHEFETRLNWGVATKKVKMLIEEI